MRSLIFLSFTVSVVDTDELEILEESENFFFFYLE